MTTISLQRADQPPPKSVPIVFNMFLHLRLKFIWCINCEYPCYPMCAFDHIRIWHLQSRHRHLISRHGKPPRPGPYVVQLGSCLWFVNTHFITFNTWALHLTSAIKASDFAARSSAPPWFITGTEGWKPLWLRIELSLLSDHRPVQAHMCNTNINTNTAFLIIGSSPRCIYMFYTYTLCSWGSSEHVLLWSRARFVWYKLWTKVLYVVNGFDTKMKHM